jgi:hypothetical protein
MTKVQMPTTDIPTDQPNLSPALAVLTAQLATPLQFAAIMARAVLSVNAKCSGQVRHIGK